MDNDKNKITEDTKLIDPSQEQGNYFINIVNKDNKVVDSFIVNNARIIIGTLGDEAIVTKLK